jgi:YHS domain-containing protein
MKHLLLVLTVIWTMNAWSSNEANVDKNGVMLSGFDPVSYFIAKQPQPGLAQFQTTYSGGVYWFSSEENRQLFLKEPKKYEPQFGGWCAYAVADSKSKVEVDPQSYLIQDGRLLLFYNGFWGNTREKWLHTKNKDPKTFLQEADAHWPAVKTKEP